MSRSKTELCYLSVTLRKEHCIPGLEMKTSSESKSVARWTRARFPGFAPMNGRLLCTAIACAFGAARADTLFMGADVSIAVDGQLYALRDVSGSSWVVESNGKKK